MRYAGLLVTEHFQQLPCGVRAKYVGGGCRCLLCRAANARYATARAAARKRGEWNGLVDAAAARAHLVKLSRAGVGRNTVADISGVARSVICAIKSGRKITIRKRTQDAILGVTRAATAMGTHVPARQTWKLLDVLIDEGFTKTRLARELGSTAKSPSLQLRTDVITRGNAIAVQRLYRRYMETA